MPQFTLRYSSYTKTMTEKYINSVINRCLATLIEHKTYHGTKAVLIQYVERCIHKGIIIYRFEKINDKWKAIKVHCQGSQTKIHSIEIIEKPSTPNSYSRTPNLSSEQFYGVLQAGLQTHFRFKKFGFYIVSNRTKWMHFFSSLPI